MVRVSISDDQPSQEQIMTVTHDSPITLDPVTVVEAQPGPTPRPRDRRRAIASWTAVGAAVITVGVLAVNVIDSDPGPRTLNLHHDVGDAKDNRNFGPVAAIMPARLVTNLNWDVGDAKDHPRFGPVAAITPIRPVTNLNEGVGDAKDHAGFGERVSEGERPG
jgi:hypothetical protein